MSLALKYPTAMLAAAVVSGCATVTVQDSHNDREYELRPDGELAFVRDTEAKIYNKATGEYEPVDASMHFHSNASVPNTVHTMHFVQKPEQKALAAANALCELPEGSPAQVTQLSHAFKYFGQNYYRFKCPEPGKEIQ